MSDTKPDPLYTPPHRKTCPVCGTVSYSLAGIHPQCAMQMADAPRMERIRIQRKLEEVPKKPL